MHSTFMDMVVNGEKNPLFEWETHFRLNHAEVIRGLGRPHQAEAIRELGLDRPRKQENG